MYVVMDMCDVSLCIPVEAGEFFLKFLKVSKKNWEIFVILKKKMGLVSACCEKHKKTSFGREKN